MLSSDRIRGRTRFGKALNLIFPKLSSQNMRGFHHATILSPSFHGVRKERLAQWPPISDPKMTKMPGRYFQKNWVGMCGTLPETLTLFQTKICDFPYPISDLIKNLIPYFRPEALEPGAWPERVTSCYGTYTVVGVNIKREMVLSLNDEEVANSSKNISSSRLECTNHTLFQSKTAQNIFFGAAHTYIAYIRDYPPPPPPRGEKRFADYEYRCFIRKRD